MTYRVRLALSAELRRLWAVVDMLYAMVENADYARIEVAQPWPLFSADGTLFTFVPFFDAQVFERST